MPDDPRAFRRLLAKLPGLLIKADDLFLSDNDRHLVVSRLMKMHPSEGPDACLDKKTFHDGLLELMENYHSERDVMWMRSRMEPRFWCRVGLSTPWADGLVNKVIRRLALGLAQAAHAHTKNPRLNRNRVSQPYCKLAIAALRFAHDIDVYEGHLRERSNKNYAEFRVDVVRDNGRPAIGPDGKQCTQVVFPASHYKIAENDPLPAGTLSGYYDATQDEPDKIKVL